MNGAAHCRNASYMPQNQSVCFQGTEQRIDAHPDSGIFLQELGRSNPRRPWFSQRERRYLCKHAYMHLTEVSDSADEQQLRVNRCFIVHNAVSQRSAESSSLLLQRSVLGNDKSPSEQFVPVIVGNSLVYELI